MATASTLMPAPIAKPKANDLIDRVNALSEKSFVDELELLRIKKDAGTIADAGRAEGNVVLEMIAAMKGDAEEVQRQYASAMRKARPEEVGWIELNHVTSLQRTRQFVQAMEFVDGLLKRYPDDLTVLTQYMDTAVISCCFEAIEGAFQHARKLSADTGTLVPFSEEGIASVRNRMKELGYTDKDLLVRCQAASALLYERGARSEFTVIRILADGSIVCELSCRITEDQAADLNFEIANKLATEFEDTLTDMISFSCAPCVGSEEGEHAENGDHR